MSGSSEVKAWNVIVPFSRPAQSRHIADGLLCQTHRPSRVIIAGNGGGVVGLEMDQANRLAEAGIEVVMLQLPEANLCKARNAGLEYALRLEAEWLIQWDDDDHYLPGYLEAVSRWAADDRIVGSRPHVVADDQGLFRVTFAGGPARGPAEWLNGGAQAYPASVARRLRYPLTPYGEDIFFCLLAKQLRIQTYDVGPGHFVYDRRGSVTAHAWRQDARKHMAWFHHTEPMTETLEEYLARPENPPGHGAPIVTQ